MEEIVCCSWFPGVGAVYATVAIAVTVSELTTTQGYIHNRVYNEDENQVRERMERDKLTSSLMDKLPPMTIMMISAATKYVSMVDCSIYQLLGVVKWIED